MSKSQAAADRKEGLGRAEREGPAKRKMLSNPIGIAWQTCRALRQATSSHNSGGGTALFTGILGWLENEKERERKKEREGRERVREKGRERHRQGGREEKRKGKGKREQKRERESDRKREIERERERESEREREK